MGPRTISTERKMQRALGFSFSSSRNGAISAPNHVNRARTISSTPNSLRLGKIQRRSQSSAAAVSHDSHSHGSVQYREPEEDELDAAFEQDDKLSTNWGTMEDPVLVPSTQGWRIVGCRGEDFDDRKISWRCHGFAGDHHC